MIVLNLLLKRKEGDRVLNYSSTYHECNLCTCRPAYKTGVFNPILKCREGGRRCTLSNIYRGCNLFFDFFFFDFCGCNPEVQPVGHAAGDVGCCLAGSGGYHIYVCLPAANLLFVGEGVCAA